MRKRKQTKLNSADWLPVETELLPQKTTAIKRRERERRGDVGHYRSCKPTHEHRPRARVQLSLYEKLPRKLKTATKTNYAQPESLRDKRGAEVEGCYIPPPPTNVRVALISKFPDVEGCWWGGDEHRVNKIMQAGLYFCFTTAVLSHRIKLSTRSDTMYFIPAIQYGEYSGACSIYFDRNRLFQMVKAALP